MADNSRHLNGTTDLIKKVNPGGSIVTNGAFSMFGWFYVTANTFVGLYGIGSSDMVTRGFFLYLDGSGKLNASGGSNIAGATTVTANAWHRYLITKAGANSANCKVYLDNSLDVSATIDAAGEITTGDAIWVAPSSGGIGLGAMAGRAAWMGFIQGVALSQAAGEGYLQNPQSAVTDYGSSGGVTANALKHFWPMQCSNATELDVSGQTNDGTYTGTSLGTGDGPSPSTPWSTVCSGVTSRTLFYRSALDGCSVCGPKQFNPIL